MQLFEKKGEGRAGQGLGSERLGAGQHRARAKARAKGRVQGRQGAGRVQGQGKEGRAGLQDSILRFSRPENLKITFLQLFEKKGEGRAGFRAFRSRARAKGRAGRAQAGCRGRVQRAGGGQGRVWVPAKARAKGRAGCRAGRAQAGCRGRAQRAGQGCKIPF